MESRLTGVPTVDCAAAVRGRLMPKFAITESTKPEQSAPLSGWCRRIHTVTYKLKCVAYNTLTMLEELELELLSEELLSEELLELPS